MDNENLTSKITKQVPARRIAKEGVKARAQSGLGRVRPVNPGSRVDQTCAREFANQVSRRSHDYRAHALDLEMPTLSA